MIINWVEITGYALIDLWQGFLNFIPSLIGAIIVLIFGWIIAIWVGKIVASILRKLKIDKAFGKGSWKQALEKADLKVDVSEFIGAILKWILIIVFLYAAVEILEWEAFGLILLEILAYLPNVIVAALIFVVTIIIVDIIEKIIKVGAEGVKEGYGQTVSMIARWAIWIFAILIILQQLLIVPELVEIVFGAIVYGVMAFLVISIGIAFGLGGKDVAAEILQDLKNKLKK